MAAGRKPTGVEYFRTLRRLSGCRTDDEFARACDKKPANISAYLNGGKVPGDAAILSATAHLFEWCVRPVQEMALVPKKLSTLPLTGGIYVLYDSAGNALYIGKATNLRAEVQQRLGKSVNASLRFGPTLNKSRPKYKALVTCLSIYTVPSTRMRHNLEALLQRIIPNQLRNANVGAFK